ncbi:MAG: hypothetical protein ABIN55_12375 [Aeromicrobium sp.]
MEKLSSSIIAFVAGLVLAGVSVFGVVQSQHNAGNSPVDLTKVNYGN